MSNPDVSAGQRTASKAVSPLNSPVFPEAPHPKRERRATSGVASGSGVSAKPRCDAALTVFIDHYRQERSHQGKDNLLLPPSLYLKQVREAQSVVASGSLAYSSITAMPHVLF